MALEHDLESALAEAVRITGSQSAFGRLFEKNGRPIRQSTVRAWLLNDSLPAEYVLAAEAATGVSRYRLRHDVFGSAPEPLGQINSPASECAQ